jgi:muramidase (phage lysozyme)
MTTVQTEEFGPPRYRTRSDGNEEIPEQEPSPARRRDRKGRYRRCDYKEGDTGHDADESVEVPDYVKALESQLKEIKRHTKSLHGGQQVKRALIAYGVQAAVSLFGVWVVASGDRAVVWGFSIAHNINQITATVDSCKADWWGCATLKYKPAIAWDVSPRNNVTAMLDLVAWAEGTDTNYNRIYTGAEFTDYSKHPDRVMCSAGLCSAAAGRYQFMPATWATVKAKLNLPDFSPASQDKAAIQLMKDAGCYGAAVRGDVADFTDRCWTQWASFQGANGAKLDARQRSHPIDKLQAKYQEFLGTANGTSITAPLPTMTMTSPMAPNRTNPVSGESRPHNGADYACSLGEAVKSPIAGTFHRGNDDPQGFGNTWGSVEGQGQTVTIGHTRALLVADGQSVTAGQPIAECGAEGSSTGPHLHLEIRRQGQLIDPQTLLGNS